MASVKDSINDIVRRKPGIGWVRGDQAIDPAVYKDLESLRKENDALRSASESGTAIKFPSDIAHGKDLFTIKYCYTYYDTEYKMSEEREEKETKPFTYSISWDDLIILISDILLEEPDEEDIWRLFESDINRRGRNNRPAKKHNISMALFDNPIRQIRYQLEHLGIIRTQIRKVEMNNPLSFSSVKKWKIVCFGQLLKREGYIFHQMMALPRPK